MTWRPARRARTAAVLVALGFVAGLLAPPQRPSRAQASAVSGEAYGHYTNVGLFGGPQRAVGPAPYVTLPPGGSEQPVEATEVKASAVYGPAHIFSGRWPVHASTPPPSGPIKVTTVGKPGPGAYVTSTASIGLHPQPVPIQCDGDPPGTTNCTSAGGFGPVVPVEGDELHSTCTVNESGATGSARFVKAELAKATDPGGEPMEVEPVPENPPPNYERTGMITNVGDRWRIVFNEQIREPDGSLTVNAIHMSLLGDIAVGEQILGHVRCSITGSPSNSPPPPPTTAAPPPSTAVAAAAAAGTGDTGDGGTSALPFVLIGAGVLAGIVIVMLLVRRRSGSGPPPAPPSAPA